MLHCLIAILRGAAIENLSCIDSKCKQRSVFNVAIDAAWVWPLHPITHATFPCCIKYINSIE